MNRFNIIQKSSSVLANHFNNFTNFQKLFKVFYEMFSQKTKFSNLKNVL